MKKNKVKFGGGFFVLLGLAWLMMICLGTAQAADQRIQYTEEMVGAGHPTKSDTLNRLTLVEHNTDGTHKSKLVNQIVGTTYATYSSTSTVIPYDDTIPQNTEGSEIMTLAITPGSATNILVIEVQVFAATSLADLPFIVGLFQDSTANALTAGMYFGGSATYFMPVGARLVYKMAAGTTSSTTFKVRVGPGAAATLYFNGSVSSRLMGGVMACSLIITEITQ